MLNRRIWVVALVALLLMSSLAGCAMGDVSAPDREVPISIDAALEGQAAGMQGLMSGSVTWTESQLSSFLTELLKQNTGPNQPVDSIVVWLEPDNMLHARVALKDGVLLGGSNIDLMGKVMVQDGKDVVMSFGGLDILVLKDVRIDELRAEHLYFQVTDPDAP